MEWLNRLVSEPYYLSHFLVFFSYFIIRSSAAAVLSPHIIDYLFYREIQAILAFSVLIVVTIAREEAWEEFIANTLFYAKVLLVAVTLLIDYHLTLWYMVVFLGVIILTLCLAFLYASVNGLWPLGLKKLALMYTLTQQPAFQKLGTSSKLTPLQLEALLTEGKTSRYWLVEFRAQCSSTCVRSSRYFPELSITYSNKILSFGIIDLGLFPNAAEKFGISLGSLGQLPSYILFESAVEINRFPELSFEEKFSHPPITKRFLAQHFQLDRLLIEYINAD